MKKVSTLLDQYFFTYSRFPSLGLIRIAIIAFSLLHSYQSFRGMEKIVALGGNYDLMHEPTLFVKVMHVPFPLPGEYRLVFTAVFYLTGICALLGIFTRPALLVYGLLYIYIVDINAARGFFDHEASLSTQIILALAFVPGSSSFSMLTAIKWIHRRIKARDRYPKENQTLLDSMAGPPVPVWGVKLLLIMLAVTYFTSGLSKVRFTGWQWVNGETLSFYLDGRAAALTDASQLTYVGPKEVAEEKKWKDGFGLYSYSYGNWQKSKFWREVGKTIAANRPLIAGISVATVLFELSGLVILFGGWIRIFYLLGAILLHTSIGRLMNLPFYNYQAVCFLLIDWGWAYSKSPVFIRQRLEPVIGKTKFLLAKI